MPNRYVDDGIGSNAYNGEFDTVGDFPDGPWATLQYAADTIAAGTAVYVADGNYKGFFLDTHVASSSAWTQFIGSGNNCVIDEVSDANGNDFYPGILISDCEYVRFQLVHTDGTTWPQQETGVQEGEGYRIKRCHNVDVWDSDVHYTTDTYIHLIESTHCRLWSCTFFQRKKRHASTNNRSSFKFFWNINRQVLYVS